MSGVLEQLPLGSRVLVIRLRSMGDCVLTTPALEILHRARPDIQVAIVVESRFAALFEGNPNVTAILPPEVRRLVRWRPALCLNLHGGPRSLALALASGARWRAGFGHFRWLWAYNIRIPRAQEILGLERTVHTAEHLASAIFFLGAPRQEIPRAWLSAVARRADKPYAVLHPAASAAEKSWPADRFLQAAAHLRENWGLETVFVGAAGDDLSAFNGLPILAGAPLAEVKNLIAGASLFIGNDSGPAHVAAAFGLPVLVLFGPSDPAIWGPWKTASEVLVSADLRGITVAGALEALERLRVRA